MSDKTTWEYRPENIINFSQEKISQYEYRPFDIRFIYYDDKFLSRSRSKIMDNFFNKMNIGIETSRNGDYIFIGKYISDEHFVSDNSFKFPLYTYPKTNNQKIINGIQLKQPNLKKDIVNAIAAKLCLTFTNNKSSDNSKFAPIDLLDYIYSVLHSPNYREKYKEFLKIDFPKIPYPEDQKVFWQLVEKGGELRQLHLMESSLLNQLITSYPEPGDNLVENISFDGDEVGKVWINKSQYFDKVSRVSWEFYIGGYQPCQKWLKDRKGRKLSFDDIVHYQKIIIALKVTGRIMGEIDEIVKF